MHQQVSREFRHLKNKVYYSQNREDLILETFFPNQKEGFYVDVGAYDPDYDSVTKLFYRKGWRGINVEPQKDRYQRFIKKRPQDININCGVDSTRKNSILRIYKNNGLSTFSPAIKEEYRVSDEDSVSEFTEVEVEMRTLKSIFREYQIEKIDFMKIDVEGLEFGVLKSNDWSRYRPNVMCIEANHMVKDWRSYVLSKGYIFVFFDGLNDYYAASEDVARRFNYPNHIITTRGGGLAAGDYHVISRLYNQLEREKKITEKETIMLRNKLRKVEKRLVEVGSEMDNPKFLAARLIYLIVDRVRGK